MKDSHNESRIAIDWIAKQFPAGKWELKHSEHGRVVNFTWGDRIISAVESDMSPSPFALGVRGIAPAQIRCLEKRRDGTLLINGRSCDYKIAQVFDARFLPHEGISKETIQSLSEYLSREHPQRGLIWLLQGRPETSSSGRIEMEISNRFLSAYRELRNGNCDKCVSGMKGLGWGLTPAGDDFLVGLLMGISYRDVLAKNKLSKIRHLIYTLSLAKNRIVNVMLYQAAYLLVNRDWQYFLRGLEQGRLNQPALTRILASGYSSGADSLTGFVSAFDLET